MPIKKRTHSKADEKAINQLADQLADKGYGDEAKKSTPVQERLVRTSLSLPASLQENLEDMALRNKRAGQELRTVSAIVRVAVEEYFKSKK